MGFLMSLPAQAVAPPLPIEDYWQTIEEIQALIAGLEHDAPETHHASLLIMADRLESITQVSFPDGRLVSLDHSFLATQLRADPPDLIALQELLASLLATRHTWPQSTFTSPDIETLERILARSEFQWQAEPPWLLAEWWQTLRERFWRLLLSWLPDDGVVALNGSLLSYALTALGIVSLMLVLGYILQSLLADFVTEAEVDHNAEARLENLTADIALKQAQRLSGDGDYRTAVRYLYLSSLLLLEERGLLRYDRSQTNREYLRSIAHLPELATILSQVIEVFDRVWYGYQPLDQMTYTQYAALVSDLRRQT